jgi:hypothetical protein
MLRLGGRERQSCEPGGERGRNRNSADTHGGLPGWTPRAKASKLRISQADPGARLLAIEILLELDVAGLLERPEMGAEIALGSSLSIALRRTNSSRSPRGNPFSAAMILRRSGWWMTGSGCSISDTAEPAPGQDQRAAADRRHPQSEIGGGTGKKPPSVNPAMTAPATMKRKPCQSPTTA